MPYVIATFYHFFDFPDRAEWRPALSSKLKQLGIKGTLLLAPDGINSTIAGTRAAVDEFLAWLKANIIKSELEFKESQCDRQPFGRAKVRLKKETISLGEAAPIEKIGIHIEPCEWNSLLDDPDLVLIDARNKYETHLGGFEGAIDPGIQNFRQLPDFVRTELHFAKHKKIAAYCTGGIRCEKFTAWLAGQGFKQVYHLKGGILKYLQEIPENKSRWRGECYVFDERIAVRHGLAASPTVSMCMSCGHPLTPEDRTKPQYREAESCPYCCQLLDESLLG